MSIRSRRHHKAPSQSQKPDWNSVWAPVSEQNSQGGYISSFYQGNRVLSGDSFWVQV